MENDTQFEDVKIISVEGDKEKGWTIQREDGWSFWVSNDSPIVPTVGMIARFYGRGIGYTVRGLFLKGIKVFYRTEAEDEAKHRQEVENSHYKRREEFLKNRADHDARIAKLPDIFQKRLAKFTGHNPDFRWKYESYELMCCEQAVLFAETLKTPEAVQAFYDANSDEQKRLVPGLDGGHSGNSFGFAVKLAYVYLTKPEGIEQMYGALAPLVGSEEYGCVPREAA